ncbi:MAG TPA: elongation factor P maturation arginine rhamnosyltransferase EarP [Ramlibacter sp.]|nr:elongation factor P maturation arginine rhamnosyltransferase EarP [Ramlibacter sp.]
MLWDIFCQVIDNHGDIGVCWRLAAELARQGEHVRLRVDDPGALQWMAPQGAADVEVLPWSASPGPGDVVIEAFGCELPLAFQALIAQRTRAEARQPVWVNLEYLTAESFAERSHGLPSPVMGGPAAGLVKRFFYPGFTTRTGGLVREADLLQRQAAFDRSRWLDERGIAATGELLVSMFCYEPAAMPELIEQLAGWRRPVRMLVTAGRATAAVQLVLGKDASRGQLAVTYLPLIPQPEFDHLLWACDFNFVRGEDSVVRALWAGAPFVWQLYPQHDGAHHAKLEAFLEWLPAPASCGDFHRAWNGMAARAPAIDPEGWRESAALARERLLSQQDLVTQLLRFVRQPANMSSAGS